MTPAINRQAELISMLYTREARKREASKLLQMMVEALRAKQPKK